MSLKNLIFHNQAHFVRELHKAAGKYNEELEEELNNIADEISCIGHDIDQLISVIDQIEYLQEECNKEIIAISKLKCQLDKDEILNLKVGDKVYLTDTSTFPDGLIEIVNVTPNTIYYTYVNPEDPIHKGRFFISKTFINGHGECGDGWGDAWVHLYRELK